MFGALYYKTYLNSKKPRREAGVQVVDKSDIAEKVHLLNVGTEHSGNAIEKAAIWLNIFQGRRQISLDTYQFFSELAMRSWEDAYFPGANVD